MYDPLIIHLLCTWSCTQYNWQAFGSLAVQGTQKSLSNCCLELVSCTACTTIKVIQCSTLVLQYYIVSPRQEPDACPGLRTISV